MANALIISKQTGGYFAFNLSIDGAPQEEVRSIQNDLLTVGNTLHFKTSNGANIIKQQDITPAELTIIASGTFTFATVTQVWDKLIEIGFFDWLGTGGGAGVDRFDDLLDTFQYFGKDGYVCVVNESQQKLEAVPFYNYRKFTDLEDSPSFLVPNKMVVVNPTGTSLILQDQPPTPDTYLNSVGYFDYNDSITHTTPLAFVTNTPKKLTNDTLGVNTNTSENPYGVSFVWNSTNNQFDFSQLSIGDTIDIRIQVQVTTTTANQKFKISAKFGIGSVAQFENTILSSQVKTAGLEEISFVAPFYIGSSYIRDFPAELYITSDAGGTVVVDGWYIRILRKNINILTIESSVPDATTLVKGIVRLGGDLSGTADNPTVPALATKIANTRLINTTAPLSGGGDLSVDRTISIPQANTSTNGYLAGGDWTTFNNKQNGSANLTSVSSLSYVSPAFVKMTGLNTFTLDTNTYLTATTGVTTFSAGTTGLTPSTATSGAVTLAGTLNVLNGGTGSATASGARTNLGATTVGGNVFTSTNPTAITFLRANADNTVSWLDATTFRTAIGAGTSSTVGTVTSVSALTLGTTGTDLSSTVATGTTTPVITLNVPTASATNRGVLSSADWSTFNGKQNAIAYTPADDSLVVHKSGTETITGTKTFSASPLFDLGARYKTPTVGYQNINALDNGWSLGVGSITQSLIFNTTTNYNYTYPNASGTLALTSDLSAYQTLLTNPVTGTGAGTTNYLPKFTGVNALGNSAISDNGSLVNLNYNAGATIDTRLNIINSGNGGSGRGTSITIGVPGSSNSVDGVKLNVFTTGGATASQSTDFAIQTSLSGVLNERMRITDNGNIGVNTSTPNAKITVVGGTNGATTTVQNLVSLFASTNTGTTLKFTNSTLITSPVGSEITSLRTDASSSGDSDLIFKTSGGATLFERMRIASTGNVGFGTTTPIGKVNIFTGITGADFSMSGQQNGSISFSNAGTVTAIPTMSSKSNDGTGLLFVAGTNDVNSSPDMRFDARTNTSTDFTTLTTPAFKFTRAGNSLIDILRNGNFLIGTTIDNNATLNIGKNITGAATSFGTTSRGMIQSNVTSAAYYNYTAANTQATTFTTSTLGHYVATQGTFGAGSTVTTQYGFGASATIAGATNNYGFTGNLVEGTNNYNLYMSGTAKNYLAGSLLVGTTTDAGTDKLQVAGNISNNSQQNIIYSSFNNDAALFQRDGGYGPVIRIGRKGVSTLASIDYPNSGEMGLSTNGAERINIASTGVVKVSNLAGTGTRTVVADASGILRTSATSTGTYKVYTALISQSGTSAPTATVLENTLGGTVILGRTGTGNYTFTLTGAFTLSKTFISFNFGSNAGVSPAVALSRVDANFCRVQVSSAGVDSDNIINGSFLEIRVYL